MGGPKWGGKGRDPEKTRAWTAKDVASGKAAERTWRWRLKHKYGITEAEYDVQYALQRGRCAICDREFDPRQRPATDHNHETGRFRGILCHPCNWILGYARDDQSVLAFAIDYLRRNIS